LRFILDSPDILSVLVTLSSFLVSIVVYRWLELGRNGVEDEEFLRGNVKCIGTQFARTNFRYLENVIHGKNSGSHIQILTDYLHKNRLPSYHQDWVCPKVFVMFPYCKNAESMLNFDGSVQDILKKQRQENQSYRVLFEEIETSYSVNGQERKSILPVIKFSDPKVGGVMYAVMAENRLLVTLMMMARKTGVQFTRDNYILQVQLYEEELRRLVEQDPVSARYVEILKFDDSVNLSNLFVERIRTIRSQEI